MRALEISDCDIEQVKKPIEDIFKGIDLSAFELYERPSKAQNEAARKHKIDFGPLPVKDKPF